MSTPKKETTALTNKRPPIKTDRKLTPSASIKFEEGKRYRFNRMRPNQEVDPDNEVMGSGQTYLGERLVNDLGIPDFDIFCLLNPMGIKPKQTLYCWELDEEGFPEYLGEETILKEDDRKRILERRRLSYSNSEASLSDNGVGSLVPSYTGVRLPHPSDDENVKKLWNMYNALKDEHHQLLKEYSILENECDKAQEKLEAYEKLLEHCKTRDQFITPPEIFRFWYKNHNEMGEPSLADSGKGKGIDRLADIIEVGLSKFAEGVATGNGTISQRLASSPYLDSLLGKSMGGQTQGQPAQQTTTPMDGMTWDEDEDLLK